MVCLFTPTCTSVRQGCSALRKMANKLKSVKKLKPDNTALPGVMRYKNPTPNPLPASDEGAKSTLYNQQLRGDRFRLSATFTLLIMTVHNILLQCCDHLDLKPTLHSIGNGNNAIANLVRHYLYHPH